MVIFIVTDQEMHFYSYSLTLRRKKIVNTEVLVKDIEMNIARCRTHMKNNSSSIVRDQLLYKRIQTQMSKQRALYQEQKSKVIIICGQYPRSTRDHYCSCIRAGRHPLSYPLTVLSRYLERLVRSLVHLPGLISI